MKNILAFILTIFLQIITAFPAHATDTLPAQKQINEMQSRLHAMQHYMYKTQQSQQLTNENIASLQSGVINEFENLQTLLTNHLRTLDSIENELTQLRQVSLSNRHQAKSGFIASYIFHAVALLLIILLIVYILSQRKRSFDFLLSRTNLLAGQNDELLDKVEELTNLKKVLALAYKKKKKSDKSNNKEKSKSKKKK